MKASEIRKRFLEYFERRGHKIIESSPLVPADDPTLLFTSAGMVQFKEYFQAADTANLKYTRAASCQKCLRAGGKKSDLENVGRTARHQSFFEMLGNFSFGDYFKKEAIAYAWEFSVEEMGIDPSRIWATVYTDDDEAYALWTAYLPETRIVRLGKKDNFWGPAGETGPCGPSSELYYDYGPEHGCGSDECAPGCECDRFVEYWNLVFTQFNMDKTGELTPLKKTNIDTGMGLERLASILQGADNNFKTDLFMPLIEKTSELLGVEYNDENAVAFRIIADHVKAVTFAFSDGIIPSNEGRGYVLRRILRRGLRQAEKLGCREPFMYRLSAKVAGEYGDFYPELRHAAQHTQHLIKMEEERFMDTLSSGLSVLSDEMAAMGRRGVRALEGPAVFKLYDTYGFPPDLTKDILEENGFEADMEGFERAMAEQRRRGRDSWEGASDEKRFGYIIEEGIPATEFTGYEKTGDEAAVLHVQNTPEGCQVIFDRTPFYGESGGQAGDTGRIICSGAEYRVTDTQKSSGVHIHMTAGDCALKPGDLCRLEVDKKRRMAIQRNHTATHLLHRALKDLLGEHVNQAGSHVDENRLRFDFTHFSQITREELYDLEKAVNRAVMEDHEVVFEHKPVDEAREEGAVALFGEKYGDVVRVISMGGYSKELCGGTHLSRTGQAGFFKIISEGSVSTGIRRIEAVTGEAAVERALACDAVIREISSVLKTDGAMIPERVESLLKKEKELHREIERMKMKDAGSDIDDFLGNAETEGGVTFVKALFGDADIKVVRETAQKIKDRIEKNGVVVAASSAGDKITGVVMVTADLNPGLKAGDIAAAMAAVLGGGGGGRPDMAQFGGRETGLMDEALKAALGFLRH